MRGLTKNQIELLQHVQAGGPDGTLDFDQLLDLLSWTPSKEATQFTIRACIKKGLMEKAGELQLRRGRRRMTYQLTEEGRRALDPRPALAARSLGLPMTRTEAGLLASSGAASLEVSEGLISDLEETLSGVPGVPELEVLEG